MMYKITKNINNIEFVGYTLPMIIDHIRLDMCEMLHVSYLEANKLKWRLGRDVYKRFENYVASTYDTSEEIVNKIYIMLGNAYEISDTFSRNAITLIYDTDINPSELLIHDMDIIPSNLPTPYDACFDSDYHKGLFKKTDIKNVIFNGPATIVCWTDGTKTIVRCQGCDTFDPEKGLAMAIAKRVLGDKGNYNDIFRKWIPKEEK